MPGERVIAVDLGASSGRVIGVRLSDGVVSIDSMHRFPNGPVRREVNGRGRWCWDIDAIMEGVIEGITLVAAKGPVHSIAVDSWAVDYGLIDEDGQLVAPVTAYRDDRHLAAFQRLRTEIGDQEIYGRTGIQFLPFNTLYQLATDALDPGRPLDRAAVMLMIPDLVANRLCGSVSGERTNAGSTQCFDVQRGAWAEDLLKQAGVPSGLMPSVVAGERAEPLGELHASIARRVGLAPGTPVRATASHDTASAVAAAPIGSSADVFISSGTWSLVGFELAEPVRTPAAMRINATNEPGVFGTTRFLRNVAGLWLLQECRRTWAEAGRDRDWASMASMAASAEPFQTVFDPDDPSLAAPGDMPARIARVVEGAGEPLPRDDASMVRAILDSVALKAARTVSDLGDVAGRKPERIVVVGGGAANELLNRLVSACTGLPVVTGSKEATALGNAAVQFAAIQGLQDREALSGLLPPAVPAAEPEDLPGVLDMAPSAASRIHASSEGRT